VFHFVCDGWQDQQCVCIKLRVKLSKSTTETLEVLCEVSGEHSAAKRQQNNRKY
jgi:hypothetical protein